MHCEGGTCFLGAAGRELHPLRIKRAIRRWWQQVLCAGMYLSQNHQPPTATIWPLRTELDSPTIRPSDALDSGLQHMHGSSSVGTHTPLVLTSAQWGVGQLSACRSLLGVRKTNTAYSNYSRSGPIVGHGPFGTHISMHFENSEKKGFRATRR
jgi:hypothetical protein